MSPTLRQLLDEALRDGSDRTRAAARLMSLIENEPRCVPELLAIAGAPDLPRLVLGVTGPPGAGKSTLIDALVFVLRARHCDWRIGVIAVDPTSPVTGGAVLGDRARMMRHAGDPNVFIRSLASRGRLGGLTAGARGVVAVMSLLKFDVVFLETVGVGQNEVEVAQVADLTAIVIAPGLGDELQLLKAGLLEVGDLILVNKADRPGADDLQRQVLAWQGLRGSTLGREAVEGGRDSVSDAPPGPLRLYLLSATQGTGLDTFVDGLERLIADHAEDWRGRRLQAIARHVGDTIVHEGIRRLQAAANGSGSPDPELNRVLSGGCSVDEAVESLLRRAISMGKGSLG